jgi:hypothetical protein
MTTDNPPAASTTNLPPIKSFARNIYTQFGEDGIIEEILRRLNATAQTSGWCVEFGAWDGIHLSNTYNLIKNREYKAVLIEGDAERHRDLLRNIPRDDVHKICRFVTFEGDSTLDNILASTPIPSDFDLLSIDIDGCDYFILESLEKYRPKVICIEYNPTIPNEIEYVQPKDFFVRRGASAKSMQKLGERKGYSPVATTTCNIFLVRNDLLDHVLGAERPTLEQLRDDSEYKTYLFVGYDGTLLSNREDVNLVWHATPVSLEKLQPLPAPLRVFRADYSPWRKAWFALWLLFNNPKELFRHFKKSE